MCDTAFWRGLAAGGHAGSHTAPECGITHIDHSFAHALSLSAQRKVMRGKICRVDFSQQITLAESRLSSYNGFE